MAQDYSLPTGSTRQNVAVKTNIANALEALRTCFSGSTAPSNTTGGMFWLDTSSSPAVLKMRDAGDSTWHILLTLGSDQRYQLIADGLSGSLSATATAFAGTARGPGTVKRVILLASNASSSSSGNEWTVALTKYPNSAPGSPVQLFSGTVGTFTELEGVGGAAELAADTAYVLTPDQNATLADLDVLEITMTKEGSATTLNDFRAIVEVV